MLSCTPKLSLALVASCATTIFGLCGASSASAQSCADRVRPYPNGTYDNTPPPDPAGGCPGLQSVGGLMVRSSSGSCYIRDVKLESALVCDNGGYSSPPAVRVYLPRSYYDPARANEKFPVVYLLHGGTESSSVGDNSYSAWGGSGKLYQALAGYDIIVVTPEAGRLGFYSNWADANDRPPEVQNAAQSARFGCGDGIAGPCCNETSSAPPGLGAGVLDYERYQFDQIIPWVEANFRAKTSRDQRAIAGLSMGGYGATKYAAKHPDLFAAVASFSGALNSQDHNAALGFPWNQGTGQAELLKSISVLVTGNASKMFGTDNDADVRWATNNPTRLAENLRGLDIYLTVGAGCSVFDPAGCDLTSSHLETSGVGNVTRDFRTALETARSPAGTGTSAVPYGYWSVPKGTHDWPNWQKVLPGYFTRMCGVFESQAAAPATWSYVNADAVLNVYGWNVSYRDASGAVQANNLRLNRIARASASSFSVEGSGNVRIQSAPSFVAGATYQVTYTNAAISIPAQFVTASSSGRIVLNSVPVASSGVGKTTLTFTKL